MDESSPPSSVFTLPPAEGYDRWSAIYDGEDNPLIRMEETRMGPLLGSVAGQAVLDVGCGTGRITMRLAEQGAQVHAIDFSDGMLSKALSKALPGSISFQKHDLMAPLPFTTSRFDCLVCALVLEHIPNLRSIMDEFFRVLRPAGSAVISTMHPAMMLRGVSARFTDPQSGRETRPRSFDHTVSDYVMAALSAGFRIEHLGEHAVDGMVAAASPRAQKYLGWPMLLMMKLRR